jgi:hypothetical protein
MSFGRCERSVAFPITIASGDGSDDEALPATCGCRLAPILCVNERIHDTKRLNRIAIASRLVLELKRKLPVGL